VNQSEIGEESRFQRYTVKHEYAVLVDHSLPVVESGDRARVRSWSKTARGDIDDNLCKCHPYCLRSWRIDYGAGQRPLRNASTSRVPDIIAGPCRANELECPCSNVTRTLFTTLARQVSLSDHPATSNIDSFRFYAATCTDIRLGVSRASSPSHDSQNPLTDAAATRRVH